MYGNDTSFSFPIGLPMANPIGDTPLKIGGGVVYFEHKLAFQTAATLAGLKPASLFSCCIQDAPNLSAQLAHYNRQLNTLDVYFEPVFTGRGRMLVMVYRSKMLEQTLERPYVRKLLAHAHPHYARCKGLEQMLDCLKRRMDISQDFPHEIGLFLGYPVADVEGFMRNKGKNYKLSGYWKVYANEQHARDLFLQYTECRQRYCMRVAEGMSIVQLVCVAS